MTDQERPEDEAPEGPQAEEEPEAPEGAEAEEAPEASEAEEAPEASEAEKGPEAAEEPEPPAEPEPPEPAPRATRGEGAPEAVPGADLEPIRIEDEQELSFEERARLEAEAEERARLEAMAIEDRVEHEPVARPAGPLDAGARYGATGKRKRSVARIILVPGEGQIQVNGKDMAEYFPRERLQFTIRQPLMATGYEESVNVQVRVHGGGVAGQADAVRHGIARALTEIDGELRTELKRRGYLRRDSRVKERRKAGLKKARKRPQFSKR